MNLWIHFLNRFVISMFSHFLIAFFLCLYCWSCLKWAKLTNRSIQTCADTVDGQRTHPILPLCMTNGCNVSSLYWWCSVSFHAQSFNPGKDAMACACKLARFSAPKNRTRSITAIKQTVLLLGIKQCYLTLTLMTHCPAYFPCCTAYAHLNQLIIKLWRGLIMTVIKGRCVWAG